jgi:hypothetical protein
MTIGRTSRVLRLLVGPGVALLLASCSSTPHSSATSGKSNDKSNKSTPTSPAPPESPVALVDSSTQDTLAQKTADLTIEGSVTVNNTTIPIQGSGQANLSNSDSRLSLTFTQSSQSYDYSELVVGGQVYLGITLDGQSLPQLGGHNWVLLPFTPASQGGTTPFSGDPVAQLHLLEGDGDTVEPLGTKSISGIACTGYQVTPSRSQVIANIQRVLSAMQIPTAQRQAVEQVWQDSPPPTVDLWFDSSHLLRQMSLPLQLSSLPGSNAPVVGNLEVDFTNYGAPLQISPPAPSEVISYQQLLQDLGDGASSSS